MKSPGGRAAAKFNKFILDNEAYLAGTSPYSKVALLWSNSTANYYASSVMKSDFTESLNMGDDKRKGNHHNSFLGFYDMLTRSHVQFDVIDTEAVFDGRIKNYELLILPTYACIKDDEAGILKDYVKTGGNIIASFDTGMYDGQGHQREKGCLDDIFGIERHNIVQYNDVGIGYTKLAGDMEENIIPFGGSAWEVSAKGGVLAENYYPMKGRYEPFPKESYTYITSSTHGKGKTVFISGTMGEYYYEWCDPRQRKWLEETVKGMADVLIKTNAPPSVEFTLRKQKDRYILHLVNMTGGPSRPLEKTVPIHDIEVDISGIRGIRARGIYKGGEYSISNSENGCRMNIPRLDEYEVIIIEG
jgi:hypothetical protein